MSAGEAGMSLLAIVVMAVVAFLMRAGGYWMMAHVPLTPRVRRILEALPGSIVVAIVAPIVVRGGPVAALAVFTAAVVMILRRNELLAVIAGIVVACISRGAGI